MSTQREQREGRELVGAHVEEGGCNSADERRLGRKVHAVEPVGDAVAVLVEGLGDDGAAGSLL